MKQLRRLIFVVLLWLIFTMGCLLAPFLAIGLLFRTECSYARNFVFAADRLMATILGFSGKATMSTEFVHSPKYQRLHGWLNEIDAEHCERSAIKEAAYCKMSDRRLGDK